MDCHRPLPAWRRSVQIPQIGSSAAVVSLAKASAGKGGIQAQAMQHLGCCFTSMSVVHGIAPVFREQTFLTRSANSLVGGG